MIIEDGEAALAYTYAWWLTGDDAAARAAVLAAVDRPEVPGADDALRVEILLRRVRSAAVTAPTMCPASELALLHDGMGLPLDSAAGLTMIDSREARTELAHGRLEALDVGAQFEVVEPERLGGLAVGNPADVAATRQNPKLAQLRQAIMQGRDELVTVSRVDVPDELLQEVADRRDAEIARTRRAVGRPHTPAAAADPLVDLPVEDLRTGDRPRPDDYDDAEEVDLSDKLGPDPTPLGRPRRTAALWWTLGVAVVLALGTLAIVTFGGDDEPEAPTVVTGPDDATSDEPAQDATTEAAAPTGTPTDDAGAQTPPATAAATPTETADAAPTPADPPDEPTADDGPTGALVLSDTGVAVGIGADPSEEAPTATAFDPVSFEITYAGATEGDVLVATWTVDGGPFGTERVDLPPGSGTSRFSRQVPPDGWPPGQHVLDLTRPGDPEVLGTLAFTVAGEPA